MEIARFLVIKIEVITRQERKSKSLFLRGRWAGGREGAASRSPSDAGPEGKTRFAGRMDKPGIGVDSELRAELLTLMVS